MEMKDENIVVSIIIPVYNGEKFIRESLDSVVASKHKNIEIIVVNDGSSDRTYQIANEFSKSDFRVRLTSIINSGVSKARNKGMEIAKGKYYFFLDADDTVDISNFDQAVDELEINDADVWVYAYNIVDDKLNYMKQIAPFPSMKKMSTLDFKRLVIRSTYMNFCWGKFYLSEFIKAASIYFNESIKVGEDLEFQLRMIERNPYMIYRPYSIVNYRQQNESVMHSFNEHYFTYLESDFTLRKTLARNIEASAEDYDSLYRDVSLVLLSYIRKMCKAQDIMANYKKIKTLMQNSKFDEIISQVNIADLRLTQSICIRILRSRRYLIMAVILKLL